MFCCFFEFLYEFYCRVKREKLKAFFNFLYSFFFQYPSISFFYYAIFVLLCGDGSSKPQRRGRGPDKKPRKRGSDHKNYKHGLGKTRGCNTERYAAWKEGVLRKDNFCCFVTGETKKDLLTCHHLNSWDIHIDQRYDISNGITLTKTIHQAFHKEYGAGKNTKEQFEKFLMEKYKIFQYPWQNDNHEPTLSVEEIEKRRTSQQEHQKKEFLSLIKKREHKLLSANEGFFVYSKVEIYCPRHGTVSLTTVKRYKHSKTGLCCCGRQAQSDKGTWKHVNDARRRAREEQQK